MGNYGCLHSTLGLQKVLWPWLSQPRWLMEFYQVMNQSTRQGVSNRGQELLMSRNFGFNVLV
jgi:hypothetical protein